MPNISAESAHWSKRSIYRIPASVTDINKRAYKPQIVSFGPYHNGTENLKAMEEHKHRALLHFLKRSNKPLESFVDALTPVVQDLKDAYDQLDPKWQDIDKFLELMIVDGCFVLEILRVTTTQTDQAQAQPQPGPRRRSPRPPPPQPQPQAQPRPHAPAPSPPPPPPPPPPPQTQPQADQTPDKDYAINDPIFSDHGKLYIVPYLKRDMLMLENQLPMLVLEKLVSVQNDKSLKVKMDTFLFLLSVNSMYLRLSLS